MARSQNGWIANRRDLIRTYTVPGSRVRVPVRKGDVATVLLHVMGFVDAHVEDIDTRAGVRGFDVPDDWGYAERPIRGSTTLSNHASGTAVDVNAVQHPLGVRGTWSTKERRKIHRFLKTLDGVVRWGEDYSGRKDGMHFEINAGPAAVEGVADKIRAAGATEEDDMFNRYASASIGKPLALSGGQRTIGFDHEYADPGKTHGRGDPSLVDGPCHYEASYHGFIDGLPEGHLVTVQVVEARHAGDGWDISSMPVYGRTEPAILRPDGTFKGMYEFTAKTLTSYLSKRGRLWLQIDTHGAPARLRWCQGTVAYG